MKLLCFAFLLPVLSCLPVENRVKDDYFPRAIKSNEEYATLSPPALPIETAGYVSNIKPVEFQYFVPASPTQDASASQHYYSYDVIPNTEPENTGGVDENDYVDDNGEGGLARNLRPPAETSVPTSYRAYLDEAKVKQYLGSKSKYFFDKDQVGSPGKENRFRRSADGGSSSHASASASSSSGNGQFLTNQGFDNFNTGFNPRFFGPNAAYGGYDDGYQAFDQPAFFGGNGFNAGRGFAAPSGFTDDIASRFGGSDDSSSVDAHGAVSNVKGVYSSASSSMDSNGKATYSIKAGKFP